MTYPIYYPVENDTLPHLFSTYAKGTGASITMTGLAVTDIEIYKDGGATQRASDSGYTLLDTDGIDFDGITGIHGFSIDLSDDTDSGFFEVGPWYHVVVSSITVDGETVNFVACAFRIVSAARGLAGTALPNAVADAAGGLPISDAGGLDLDAIGAAAGAIDDAAATGDPSSSESIMQYVKQLINILVGANGIASFPAEAAPGNAVSLAEVIRSIYNDITGLNDPTAATIADAVWDEAIADHVGSGSFGEEVQAHALSSEISALNDLSAANVWGHATRTLTQSAASVTDTVSGSKITILRGDTLSASLTGLGDISSRTRLYFTVKQDKSQADTVALIQIEESDGLKYIDGAAAGTPANGSIAIDDIPAGDITITLAAAETAKLDPSSTLNYDVQMVTASGVTTLTSGSAAVTADVTRATT